MTVDAGRPGALLVVGVTRSGTTLVYRLLDAHPQIRLAYESKLLTEGWHEYRQLAPNPSPDDFTRLAERLARLDEAEELNGWLVSALREGAEELYRSRSFADLIEQLFERPGGIRWWGNKMLRAEVVPTVLQNWPAARRIYLLRDPRDVFASQKAKFGSRRPLASATYWSVHARHLAALEGDSERTLLIRYEELVAAPAEILKGILRFLGLEEGAAEALLAAVPVHSGSVGAWRDRLSEREVGSLEGACFEAMRDLGYEPEIAKGQRRLTAMRRGYEVFLENAHLIPWNPATWRRKGLFRRFWQSLRD